MLPVIGDGAGSLHLSPKTPKTPNQVLLCKDCRRPEEVAICMLGVSGIQASKALVLRIRDHIS